MVHSETMKRRDLVKEQSKVVFKIKLSTGQEQSGSYKGRPKVVPLLLIS